MARIFITGSSDGLGLLAGQQLAAAGHELVLHARTAERAERIRRELPACRAIAMGDVSTLAGMHAVATEVNRLGRMDGVIHNVGIYVERQRNPTADGIPKTLAVNVVAPFVLTALLTRPDRLVYLSSGMHRSGNPDLGDVLWEHRRWDGMQAYSNSKLYDAMLALALAARWPEVRVNAVDPGWVPTRMGGAGAPDDLQAGADTQAWLIAGEEAEAQVTGGYFHHRRPDRLAVAASDPTRQQQLIAVLERLSGVRLP